MLIRKIHQYILREFLYFFSFGILVFSSLLIFNKIFDLIDIFVSKQVSLIIILKLFCLLIPNILVIAIPMAIIFGILLAYGKLSEDNEIIAFKALGTSYSSLFIPTILLVSIISIIMLIFNHFIAPLSYTQFKYLYKSVVLNNSCINLNDKKAIKLGNYILYADSIDKKKHTMHRVSIYNTNNNKHYDSNYVSRITASLANIYVDKNNTIKIILYNGCLQKIDYIISNNITLIYFQYYCFFINLYEFIKKYLNYTSIYEMSSYDLYKKIQYYKKLNFNPIKYEQQFWIRWVFAIAPIALAICALPLGIINNKSNRYLGFIISLCIIIFYYLMLIVTINLSEKHYIPTNISLWLPNITVFIIGLLLFTKLVKT
jgi:lipopolysaccharide export LptBFGC system permease protein LptF